MVYLDYSATTPVLPEVLDSYNKVTEEYFGNPNSLHSLGVKSHELLESANKQMCDLLKIKEDEFFYTSGATESLNYIATGFFSNILEPNDEILITKAEHASNVLPWFRLAKELNVKVNYIPLDSNHYVTLENVLKSITPQTKVIALAQVTNVIGDLRPIKEIAKIAHERGIFLVVDGAQSVPHRKCDVKDSDVDFLAFSGHKMCGPTGVGVLYGKKELLEEVEPILLGGGMNESFDNENEVYLKDLPQRLEAGTPNIAGVIGLGAAIDYLEKIGMDTISIYEQKLKSYLISKLEKIPYIQIVNEEADSGIVAFNVEDVFSQDVAYYLNKYNICVRAGNHCAKILKHSTGVKNTVRVSLYFYNTKEEIDSLVELLSNKDKIIKEMI